MDLLCRGPIMNRFRCGFILNFVILFVNLILVVLFLDGRFSPTESFFLSNLSTRDKSAMQETLRAFVTAMDAANISRYFLYGGSLIGSYRHHGPIPWDDDIDIMADVMDKERILRALSALAPDYVVHFYGEPTDRWQWKFYDNSSSATRTYLHKPFKWPYVDLFFFAQNLTHIWDEVPMYSTDFCWPKTTVFPLRPRPFSELIIPTPCDTAAFLTTNYDVEMCRSRGYNHMMELPTLQLTSKDVPCEKLYHLFPFVRSRRKDARNNEVVETLGIAEWETKTIRMPETTGCSGVLK